MKDYFRLIMVLAIVFYLLGFFTSCSSTPPSESEAKKEQIKKDEPPKHNIAIIPFDYSFDIGSHKANNAFKEFAKVLLDSKSFQPSGMKEWMTENFGIGKAPNINAIVARAKGTGLQIDSFCHGKLFRSGRKYGIMLSLYLLESDRPLYFYRSFLNYSRLGSAYEEIIQEMETRIKDNEKPYFNKNIYISKENIKFHTITHLKSGEESIIELPYINIRGVSYKNNDHFFQELLLYNFHTMKIFNIWNSNISKYIQTNSVSPANTSYTIVLDVDISNTVSMLTAYLKMPKNEEPIVLQYPFTSLDLDNIFQTMRDLGKNIVFQLVTNVDIRKIGTLNITNVDEDQQVFCNNIFVGNGKQRNLLFPIGSVNIRIDDEQYKSYVFPYTNNDTLYNLEESALLKLKKASR